MLRLSTREAIRTAKFIAGIRNSNLSNFELTNSILNNIYRELYQKVIDAGDSYVNIINVGYSDNGILLPEDCYQIEAVYDGYGWNARRELQTASRNGFVGGTWRVINNRLFIDGGCGGSIWIKYSVLPPTLTAPDDPIPLDIPETAEFGLMTDSYLYYKVPNGPDFDYFVFDLDKMESEPVAEESWSASEPLTYNGLELTVDYANQTITDSEGNRWEDYVAKDELTFTKVVTDDPYMMVSYSDGTIRVYQHMAGADWNIMDDTGHKTLGEIVAMKTNDRTGKGCIWISRGKVYYCSFVPDTVLSYPNNTFFQLLEYKLAQFLAGQAGIENVQLEGNLLPDAEMQFYSSITKNNNITRTNNIYGR